MKCIAFSALAEKEVINMPDCRRLGTIIDADIDIETGRILSFAAGEAKICGRKKNTVTVPFEAVRKIGDDIIFVDICLPPQPEKHGKGGILGKLSGLFG